MFEKLRAKSERVKKGISLGLTIFIFSGILFVWISSLDARRNEEAILAKTASPVASFTSLFDGLVLDFRDMMSGVPSFAKHGASPATSTVPLTTTSTDNFDLSGVVIIDATSTPVR